MRRTTLAALATATILCIAGFSRADDAPKEEPSRPPAPPTTPGEPAPATRPDEAKRARVLEIIDEVRLDAAKVRGLAWKEKVPADLITREELKTRLAKMIQEDLVPAEYERDVKIMRRFGLLKDGEDPLEMMKRFLESGIAGYYDPKTKHFYVIDGMSAEAQRPTILHELVHALEDQYVDIAKRQKALKDDSDRLFALDCMIEGSAEHARALYERANPEAALRMRKEQSNSAQAKDQLAAMTSIPVALFLPTLLHYQVGPAYVGRAVGKEYAAGMARLYDAPPTTQEQVMHPSKILGEKRDLPRAIAFGGDVAAAAGEGWKRLHEYGAGELDTVLWFDHFLGGNGGRLDTKLIAQGRWWSKRSQKAAEGWDGMRVAAIEKPGLPLLLAIASAWDSPEDATEAGEAVLEAFRGGAGAGFTGGAWKDEAGARVADYATPAGLGRIRIAGDTVLVLDGVPEADRARFDAVWAPVAATTFGRDPADTWAPGAVDTLAGSDWRDDELGLGWKKPSAEWTVEKGDRGPVFRKGDVAVQVSSQRGDLQSAAVTLMFSIARAAGKSVMPDEGRLVGRDALRFDYVAGSGDAARRTVVYAAPMDERVLVVRVETPAGSWEALAADREEALEAFRAKE